MNIIKGECSNPTKMRIFLQKQLTEAYKSRSAPLYIYIYENQGHISFSVHEEAKGMITLRGIKKQMLNI